MGLELWSKECHESKTRTPFRFRDIKSNLVSSHFSNIHSRKACNKKIEIKNKQKEMRAAFIADYGTRDVTHHAVAELVRSQAPDVVVTGGDNVYGLSGYTTSAVADRMFDATVKVPYKSFVERGAFFPAIGNHDVEHSKTWFRDKFPALFQGRNFYRVWPAGSRIEFFVLSSGLNSYEEVFEPEGNSRSSAQRRWLSEALRGSQAPFKVVVLHHPPFTSGGAYAPGYDFLRWPFQTMGAHLVLCGHEHNYERFHVTSSVGNRDGSRDGSPGIPYIVAGIGGGDLRRFQTSSRIETRFEEKDLVIKQEVTQVTQVTQVAVSVFRAAFHGAVFLSETPEGLLVQALSIDGTERDRVMLPIPEPGLEPATAAASTTSKSNSVSRPGEEADTSLLHAAPATTSTTSSSTRSHTLQSRLVGIALVVLLCLALVACIALFMQTQRRQTACLSVR